MHLRGLRHRKVFITEFASGRGRIAMTENGSRHAGHMIVPAYLHGRTIEDHGEREIALRAQRNVASSVALDVLRSSSVLKTFCQSADILANIEISAWRHTNGVRIECDSPGHRTPLLPYVSIRAHRRDGQAFLVR
jgi:hypothetical protein